jgi:RimJ/RimL family protein N-acetyltransferase
MQKYINYGKLETERLILRPPVDSDIPVIQERFPHWDIVKYLTKSVPWPYPADGAKSYFDNVVFPNIEAGREICFLLTEKGGDDCVIGNVTLYQKAAGEEARGFWLGLPWHGKGYMTEAVTAVNDYAFDVLGLQRMIVKNARGNMGSRRVKEKTGAVLREVNPTDRYLGGYAEEEVWELTAERWRRFRAGEAD